MTLSTTRLPLKRTDGPVRPGRARRAEHAWAPTAAAAAVVAALAHVPVTSEHLREAPYIGILFVALEAACVALAILLVLRPSRSGLVASAAVGGVAVAALVLSRTVGLPALGDDVGNWSEPLALVSLVAETIMVIAGLAGARGPHDLSAVMRRTGIVVSALVLLGGVCAVALAARAENAEHGDAPGVHEPGMDMHGSDMPGMDMG